MDRHAEQCKQPDMIGKGAARKLLEIDAVPDPNEAGHKAHALEGDDLKVGGEGMKGFYDVILPSEVNKFFGKAKWGNARVGKTTLEYHHLAEDGRPAGRPVHETVHSLDITPEMKAKALGEGFPMFKMEGAEARAAAATSRPWKGRQKVYQAARSIIRPGDEVLDYGSGKYLEARPIVEEAGGRYFAHDPYQGIHGDMNRKYDVVMGSNVLNVQSKARNAEGEYYEALDEMTDLVGRDGVLVVNMPLSGPRADWMTPSRLKADLQERFGSVKQQGEVFIATNRGGAARFRGEDGDAFAAAIDDFVAGKLGDANRRRENAGSAPAAWCKRSSCCYR